MNDDRTQRHLEWLDVAKGVCMVLVVLGHTAEWYARNFSSGDAALWSYLSAGLQPLRMPLFFLISGMLAASKVGRPLRNLWGKTGGLYLLYCLWAGIYCLKLALPGGRDGFPFPEAGQIIGAFALPALLWYIWALPVFYLMAWLLERCLGAKSVYALLPMVGLSIAAAWVAEATQDILNSPLFLVHSGSVCANVLWFYLGLKGRRQIVSIAAGRTAPRTAIASMLAVLAIWGAWRFDDTALAIVFTPLLLWAALEWLGRIGSGSAWTLPLAAVGRETLPIYVMHTFALAVMTFGVRVLHLETALPYGRLPLQIAGPIAVTVLLVAGCMLAGRILVRARLGFLVQPIPSPLRG